MKKFVYISLGVFLGLLLSLIVHAVIEFFIIMILVSDIEKYSFGLSWEKILLIHSIYSAITFAAGACLGLWLGLRWWKYIYVERRYTGRWFKIKDKKYET